MSAPSPRPPTLDYRNSIQADDDLSRRVDWRLLSGLSVFGIGFLLLPMNLPWTFGVELSAGQWILKTCTWACLLLGGGGVLWRLIRRWEQGIDKGR